MKWEDFKKGQQEHSCVEWVLTNIECPVCNTEIYRYALITFVSNPPKRKYKCFKCGWEEVI